MVSKKIVAVVHVLLRLKAQAKFDGRVHECFDRVVGNIKRLRRVAEVERDRKAFVAYVTALLNTLSVA